MNAKIIDWKKLSKTEGYKKIKFEWNMRKKSIEFKRKWKYIFNFLKKICYKYNLKPCFVLNKWESKRKYWYFNFYQEKIWIRIWQKVVNKHNSAGGHI